MLSAMKNRIAISALVCAPVLAGLSPAAEAHPHVFAEARLEVEVAPDGHVTALRHIWRFDELFSSTVLLEFDADTDLVLDDSEREDVAAVVTESIADYDYFQTITARGKDIPIEPVKDMKVLFEDGQLIIFFTAVPAERIDITASPSFGVYDPTFYTAIDFYDADNMVLNGAPANCSYEMVLPDPDEAIAQNQAALTDAFFSDPTDMSMLLATRMEVTCK